MGSSHASAARLVKPAVDPWARYEAWNAAVEAEFFPDAARGGQPTNIHAYGGGFLIRGAAGRFIKGTTPTAFDGGRPVYLDIEDAVLGQLAEKARAHGDPKEAFAEAVRPTLILWPDRSGSLLDLHVRRLRRWQYAGRRGAPPCLALLAFFSLAAEGMRGDETFRSSNYYARLAALVGLDATRERQGVDRLARDFRRDSLTLWNALNSWLLDAGGARGLPTAYSFDWRSYVGVPISQALLREEERLALRDLFVRYRLRPGQQLAASDMLRLLEDWVPASDLDVGVKRLFRHADAKARIADIASIELAHWDGRIPAAASGQAAPADALLLAASLRRQPRSQIQLGLVVRGIARAPVGRYVLPATPTPAAAAAFAEVGGTIELVDAPGEGWRRFEADGEIGFPDLLLTTIQLSGDDGVVLTRKPRRLVILERDEEFRVAVEVERIQLARTNIVLAHDSLADDVDAVLRASARDDLIRWTPAELRGLPLEWQAWTNVVLLEVPDIPNTQRAQDLATLIPLEWTKIAFAGGFSLPGTATWLRKAPPDVSLASFVGDDVVASLGQTDALSGEFEGEEALLSFEGSATVRLDEREFDSGDYRVALRESGTRGRALASASFRLRSGDSPRLRTEIDGEIGHYLRRDAPQAAITAEITSRSAPTVFRPWGGASPADREPLPDALRQLASFDLESEMETSEPIVTARSGSIQGCLTGLGHHYRLDDAGRDAMQRRRRAARRMIPAECMNCGHQKLFPPHLRRARLGRAPTKVVHVARSRSRRAPTLARRIPDPQTLPQGFDLLLDALTYARAGRWPLFERLAQQISDEPWFALECGRLFSALGHVDVVVDLASGRPRAWTIRPPTLVVTAAGAVLTGGRPQGLVNVLEEEVRSLGGELVQIAHAGAPATIRLHGLGDYAAVEELARVARDAAGTSLAVDDRGGHGLALALPRLADVAAALPAFDWPNVETERFHFASNKWVRESLTGPGAYRFLTRPVRFGALTDRRLVAGDSRLVKWLSAPPLEGALLAYEPRSKTLLCRLGAQLPGLYERAAVLCSGSPPEKRADGSVAYADVPHETATALYDALLSLQGS
jgi:hypothetical protein